jgi:DNA-binding NarL/FixJ family response regulator
MLHLPNPKRILICDDHQLFCEGLRAIISNHFPDTEILVANDANECSQLLNNFTFDVFICDINLKGSNGLQIVENSIGLLCQTNIIILSGFIEEYMVYKAKKIGVHYFLKKEVSIEGLIAAIQGQPDNYLPLQNPLRPARKKTNLLSKQETQIVKLIIEGKLSKEIADDLKISKTTVDTHRRNIHRKLNTNSSTDLFKLIYEGTIKL